MARPRVYLLNLRQFSNTNETRRLNGTLAENGVGKFRDIDAVALRSLRDLGVTHLWLLGVLRHATGTDYSADGLPADDPDLLKGIAGSPYAVRDGFDVCPDYAVDPARRLAEFGELVGRIHVAGLRVLIDFVPNHVARSYHSVVRPDLDFGLHDDRSRFFAPDNNFYYLEGPGPLRLPTVRDGRAISPTCQALGGCDGLYDAERVYGRVTGNNVASWEPGGGDWYETAKLNYGFDFRGGVHGVRTYPTVAEPSRPIPDTWRKMDAVLAHWQEFGVDGFRCDMAHWIPMEFWSWAIGRARARKSGTWFLAEAYDDDPNKVTGDNVLVALLQAGFDAVYDHASYRLLKSIYDGPKWANDLDAVLGASAPVHGALRYAENHDEVRLAHPGNWAGVGVATGCAVTALLFGIGRGPVLLHNGQEVGEPASHPEGFGGGAGRSSLFDYGSMPEMVRWVNGHRYDGGRLSPSQRGLRAAYARILLVLDHEAFTTGEFIPLNGVNIQNPGFGRLPGESASGHWVYAYLRTPGAGRNAVLVVANLHPAQSLAGLEIHLSDAALRVISAVAGSREVSARDLLGQGDEVRTTVAGLQTKGFVVPFLPAATTCYFEILGNQAG